MAEPRYTVANKKDFEKRAEQQNGYPTAIYTSKPLARATTHTSIVCAGNDKQRYRSIGINIGIRPNFPRLTAMRSQPARDRIGWKLEMQTSLAPCLTLHLFLPQNARTSGSCDLGLGLTGW